MRLLSISYLLLPSKYYKSNMDCPCNFVQVINQKVCVCGVYWNNESFWKVYNYVWRLVSLISLHHANHPLIWVQEETFHLSLVLLFIWTCLKVLLHRLNLSNVTLSGLYIRRKTPFCGLETWKHDLERKHGRVSPGLDGGTRCMKCTLDCTSPTPSDIS